MTRTRRLSTAFLALTAGMFAACEQPTPTSELRSTGLETRTNSAASANQATPKPVTRRLVVIAGGDVGLGRGIGRRILADPAYDPLARLKPLLNTADLVLVNLESQLSDQHDETVDPRNYLVFTGPPHGAALLRRAGIDYVSIANNHAWDYGRQAFFETLNHLEREHVAYSGGSRDPERRYDAAILRQGDWSVAVFAVTHIWNQPPYDEHPGRHHIAWASHASLAARLGKARAEHDVVLVNYHGGGEYIDQPLPSTTRFITQTLESGVDAVIGHHPHVPQGVRFANGRPAFHSLGNLVFEPYRSDWTRTGIILRLTFSGKSSGIAALVEVCPVTIAEDAHPELFDALSPSEQRQRQDALRERIRSTSRPFGEITLGDPDDHGCMSVKSAGE